MDSAPLSPMAWEQPHGLIAGLRQSISKQRIRAALTLNALLRDKHEGLNRGNADPPLDG